MSSARRIRVRVMGGPPCPRKLFRRKQAVLHSDASLGGLRGFRVVGHKNDGRAPVVDLLKNFQNLQAGRRIQLSGRFVRQKQVRSVEQRPGNGNPLLLPAGELRRGVVPPVSEPHVLQEAFCPCPQKRQRRRRIQAGKHHVFQGRSFRQKIKTLKYESDKTTSETADFVVRQVMGIFPIEQV